MSYFIESVDGESAHIFGQIFQGVYAEWSRKLETIHSLDNFAQFIAVHNMVVYIERRLGIPSVELCELWHQYINQSDYSVFYGAPKS